jgi:hypothetical protein
MASTHFDSVEPIAISATENGAGVGLGTAVYGDWTPKLSQPKDSSPLPAYLNFSQNIYQTKDSPQSVTSALGNTDLSAISFTTPAQDALSGKQPNFYLNNDGTLVANPNAKPNSIGAISIEVTGNDSAKQAKQYADKLQKQTISALITQFRSLHPGETVPEMWQAIVDSQPDASYPNGGDNMNNNTVTPADEQAYDSVPTPVQPAADIISAPAPQPSDINPGGSGDASTGSSPSEVNAGGPSMSGSGGGGAVSSGRSASSEPSSGGGSYDGASTSVDQATLLANVKTVAEVAKQLGVDPATAVADMLVESGGNNKAVGDHGHSIGLFQLNDAGGEGSGMSVAEREDPTKNAEIALSHFAKAGSGEDPGLVAYNAERPSGKSKYVADVDSNIAKANELLKQAGVT